MNFQNQIAKKLFALAAGVIFFLSPLQSVLAYNTGTATTYLQNHANSPWSTMALSAAGASSIPSDYLKTVSGTNAIDYEAPILAIAALNKDPKTFGSADLVAKLESFRKDGQIGDATTLNDDIFGILALVSAGQPLSDAGITDAKTFLLAHQNSDGGFGFSTSSNSDSNTTASVILALIAAGVNSSDAKITNALNYLKTAQNSDGGFTYDPKSSYGTDSDSSSTAWVLWALNALNIDQSTWSKGSNTPKSYLESNQDQSGFFKYQSSSSEDSFSAVTTAYAVIALAGKTLPVHIYSANSAPAQTFSLHIEGPQNTLCVAEAAGPTALDVVKNSADKCGFTYDIKTTSFGPYLDQIGSDTAAGQSGWMYLVNNISPDVGAADYQLKPNDEVLWYFGDFGWKPTRLSLDKTKIDNGQNAQATVETFDNGSWSALSGATVSAGVQSFASDNSGYASISGNDGYYKVFASKSGYIRSNAILLQIGQGGSSSINLSADIGAGQVAGTSTPVSSIAFSVNTNNLDFGALATGQNISKQVSLSNTGSSNLHLESIVTGDNLFKDNLKINTNSWQAFAADIASGQSQTETIKLAMPHTYSGSSGKKTGQLVFWASAK